MKLWCVALITSAFLVGCAGTQPSAGGMKENELEKVTIKVAKETVVGGYSLVSVDDVKKMVDTKEAVKIVDTMPSSAYKNGFIPTALMLGIGTKIRSLVLKRNSKRCLATT